MTPIKLFFIINTFFTVVMTGLTSSAIVTTGDAIAYLTFSFILFSMTSIPLAFFTADWLDVE